MKIVTRDLFFDIINKIKKKNLTGSGPFLNAYIHAEKTNSWLLYNLHKKQNLHVVFSIQMDEGVPC